MSWAVNGQAGDRGELTVASHKLEKVSTRKNKIVLTAGLRPGLSLHSRCSRGSESSWYRSEQGSLQLLLLAFARVNSSRHGVLFLLCALLVLLC